MLVFVCLFRVNDTEPPQRDEVFLRGKAEENLTAVVESFTRLFDLLF